MNIDAIFYFGCWDGAGHFLHDLNGNTVREQSSRMPADFPVAEYVLDTGLLPPKQPEKEGLATLAHLNGWTILSFWDRSVDSRGKSNSAFIMRGTYSLETTVKVAREAFPKVWARIKFEIVERT